jgi:hypothetical protein
MFALSAKDISRGNLLAFTSVKGEQKRPAQIFTDQSRALKGGEGTRH